VVLAFTLTTVPVVAGIASCASVPEELITRTFALAFGRASAQQQSEIKSLIDDIKSSDTLRRVDATQKLKQDYLSLPVPYLISLLDDEYKTANLLSRLTAVYLLGELGAADAMTVEVAIRRSYKRLTEQEQRICSFVYDDALKKLRGLKKTDGDNSRSQLREIENAVKQMPAAITPKTTTGPDAAMLGRFKTTTATWIAGVGVMATFFSVPALAKTADVIKNISPNENGMYDVSVSTMTSSRIETEQSLSAIEGLLSLPREMASDRAAEEAYYKNFLLRV